MFDEVSANLDNGKLIGEIIWNRLLKLKLEIPNLIGNVHGLGCMVGLELITDSISKSPNSVATKKLIQFCHENGLVIMSAGSFGNIIRLMPSLKISKEILHEGLNVIEDGL